MKLKRVAFAAAGAVFIVAAGAGIAYASIPGPDGVIHGCYKTSNPAQGALTVIDSSASCASGTAALNWNQAGPQGATGATGATGAQGPAGVSGYQLVVQQSADVPAGLLGDTVAHCPAGKVVTGGGYGSIGTFFTIENNTPANGNNGWQVDALNTDSGTRYYFVYAICATAS